MKFPFVYVSQEVDKLYDKKVGESDKAIDEHLEFIRTFLHACGWDEEEYIRELMGFAPIDKTSN